MFVGVRIIEGSCFVSSYVERPTQLSRDEHFQDRCVSSSDFCARIACAGGGRGAKQPDFEKRAWTIVGT